MKKVLLLSIICVFASHSYAQLFEISNDPVFQKANGEVYNMALAGGLNQPHFSTMDFDKDGKLDLLAFDKEGNKTMVFLNTSQNGVISYQYAPKFEYLFPQATEFMRLVDYNDDGKPDLWAFVDDSLTFYENRSTTSPEFAEGVKYTTFDRLSPNAVGDYIQRGFNHIRGCQPAFVDLDGDKDIDYVANLNLNGSQLIYSRNEAAGNDFASNPLQFETVDKCFGGIDEYAGKMITNAQCYFYENYLKKKHTASKTLLFFDEDEDGDLDLLYGNSEKENIPIYFFHNDRVELGYYKDTFTSIDTNYFGLTIGEQIPVAPNMSYVDIDMDGELDLILSTNERETSSYPIRQADNALLFLNKGKTENPDFEFVRNDFLVGDMLDFGSHTAPTFADLDGDKDMDLIIATNGDHFYTLDSADRLIYFENIGSSTEPIFKLVDEDYLGLSANRYMGLRPTFADLDGDKDLDLYLGKQDGSIAEYINSGSATDPLFSFSTQNFGGIQVTSSAAPCFYDMDKDGTLDMILGSYSGTLHYYENKGTASVANFELVDDTLGGIVVSQLVRVSKINPDGTLGDTLKPANFGYSAPQIVQWNKSSIGIVVGTDEGVLRLYEVPSDLDQTFAEEKDFMQQLATLSVYNQDWGAKSIPAVADLDGDGISDILVGNSRGGVNYLKGNERVTGSTGSPTIIAQPFRINPNPAQSTITISAGSATAFTYAIHTLTGQVIARGTSQSGVAIHLDQAVSNGVYFVQLQSDDVYFTTQKLIINR